MFSCLLVAAFSSFKVYYIFFHFTEHTKLFLERRKWPENKHCEIVVWSAELSGQEAKC